MGTSLAIPMVLLILIGALLGATLNFAAVFLAIPIVALLLANWMIFSDAANRRRRVHKLQQFRRSARARKFDLTDQDKRTVV
jgi:uncharacterized membrane protein YfcA